MSDRYRYTAVDSRGRRVRGFVTASAEAGAYQQLKADGLHPLRLQTARPERQVRAGGLSERDAIDLVANLGHLLSAGADMRTALQILSSRASRKGVAAVLRNLLNDIAGGGALEPSFAKALGRHGPFVGAMVSAGEASGDLAGALNRAAEILDSRQKLRRKLVSILAYPAFVLVSTVAAILALLLFVVPALAPLVEGSDAAPPLSLSVMMAASEALNAHLVAIEIGVLAAALGGVLLHQVGWLGPALDRLTLQGPVRRTASSLTYGAFAVVLGGMLTAGAPMSETLRLAVRSLRSPLARNRLEPVLRAVRQGHALSDSLRSVPGFPVSIAQLAAVGEATGALGPMLVRSGKLEEEGGLTRIETLGQLLGPILIVGLGGLVGVLMASLLSGVSQLGQSALQ